MAYVPPRSRLNKPPQISSHVRYLENPRRQQQRGALEDESESSSDSEGEAIDEALSRRYGEAAEATNNSKRSSANDADQEDIDAEYQKKKRTKTLRPDVSIDKVTGVEGLIRIPQEFPAMFRRLDVVRNNNKSVAGSALYALSVVEAYKSFCYNLTPLLAFEDTLLKIEQLGSKKQVKAYLEHMRQQVRNQHVEKVLGKDKAERILKELHDALEQQQQEQAHDEDAMQATGGSKPDDEEEEATFEDSSAAAVFGASTRASDSREDEGEPALLHNSNLSEHESGAQPLPASSVGAGIKKKRQLQEDSDDDEEELVFDDTAAPGAFNATSRRRYVLDDDDDDDDEEEMDTAEAVSAAMKPPASPKPVSPENMETNSHHSADTGTADHGASTEVDDKAAPGAFNTTSRRRYVLEDDNDKEEMDTPEAISGTTKPPTSPRPFSPEKLETNSPHSAATSTTESRPTLEIADHGASPDADTTAVSGMIHLGQSPDESSLHQDEEEEEATPTIMTDTQDDDETATIIPSMTMTAPTQQLDDDTSGSADARSSLGGSSPEQ